MTDLRNEPGWVGMFTRDRAEGALPNGTRVVKVNSEEGDGHPDGTPGVILGSVVAPGLGIGYFVSWAPRPRVVVFTADFKIRKAST